MKEIGKVRTEDETLRLAEKLAVQAGFRTALFDAKLLCPEPEVRRMCADNRCSRFGASWSCPPACGSIKDLSEQMAGYEIGLLLVSVSDVDGDFDLEGIRNVDQLHKKRFDTVVRQVRQMLPKCMPMAAGSCTRCVKCTYPDAPCRHPDRLYPSMEACGLIVSNVCDLCGIRYNNGPSTITFVSCILLK